MSTHTPCSHLTRREALALGAAAGVTAMTGVPGATLATAAAATIGGPGGPAYLRRESYSGRVGDTFLAGDHVLTLMDVADIAGAHHVAGLKGSDHAFTLRFSGVADLLPSAIHILEHEELGPFPLFISAIERPSGSRQTYEATVDRTVRIGSAPQAAPPPPLDVTPEAPPAEDAPEPAPPTARDLEIIAARRDAARAPARRKALRSKRAHARLRRAHARRVRFKRKLALERKRLDRARRGWLRRHGR